MEDLRTSLYRRVEKEPGGCWLYTGARDRHGYGRMSVPGHLVRFTHRVAYALENGPIPAGLSVCHKCDNPPCCNPAHLFLGTQADNVRDAWQKGRISLPARKCNTARTHCRKGHTLVAENTRPRAAGGVYCYECRRIYWRKHGAAYAQKYRDQEKSA